MEIVAGKALHGCEMFINLRDCLRIRLKVGLVGGEDESRAARFQRG